MSTLVHVHVFDDWRGDGRPFCAICDMPKQGWPPLNDSAPLRSVSPVERDAPPIADAIDLDSGAESR